MQKQSRQLSSCSILISILFLFLLSTTTTMAESGQSGVGDATAAATAEVHIVYVEKPQGEEPEACHLRTLTSVLGSEEAAKDAILYSYKSAASGFSAKLTPQQVSQISNLAQQFGINRVGSFLVVSSEVFGVIEDNVFEEIPKRNFLGLGFARMDQGSMAHMVKYEIEKSTMSSIPLECSLMAMGVHSWCFLLDALVLIVLVWCRLSLGNFTEVENCCWFFI
ncbi:subtilisin-like protease SBT3.17 [Thalictrum thalictroides]|uniref:Subtilisin-like protease SBT3.17 n=1 Tax=Thalictrum thalictroides TaxID=46969 RepID=A0A7J6V4S2_THATH|nr:subtilisin-like protease SBT3.17 [Thalictrum thalictroides]